MLLGEPMETVFFLVLSSNRQAGAIWLILEHEFTSESFHELSDTPPLLWNISFDMQSPPYTVAAHWLGLILSLCRATHYFTYSVCMALDLLHSLPACKIKHICFHNYVISWIVILFVLCRWDNARDLSDIICRNHHKLITGFIWSSY